MTLPVANIVVGELRVDTDLKTYRWDGSAWNLELAKTPSSSGFPDGTVAGERREDILSGREYQWTGSAWALLAGTNDSDQDGLPDVAETVPNGSITLVKMAANSVGKAALKYIPKTVQITTGTTATVTVPISSQILGWYVTAITGTESVKTMDITGTDLTVTLTGSDTATVIVVILDATP